MSRPVVIGHRGACGYRPEHTLASYRLAIELGADFIEPDLVSTRDGVLVARHENEISTTTDVADHPELADRRTTKVVDGVALTGWFTEDLTLEELKALRARERIPELRPANTAYDDRDEIPTFTEILDLVATANADRLPGAAVGVYPETKHPSYFAGIGLALEEPLVAALEAAGYRGPDARVFVQSFEVGNLRRLATMTDVALVQLVGRDGQPWDFVASGDARTFPDLCTPAGLELIAGYARAIGPDKQSVIARTAQGTLAPEPTGLVADAQAVRLGVHIWTMRSENAFVPTDLRTSDDDAQRGRVEGEYEAYWAAGVDGVFSDQADVAVATRTAAGR